MANPIPLYNLVDEEERTTLKKDIQAKYEASGKSTRFTQKAARIDSDDDQEGFAPDEKIVIPEYDQLLGVDPSVYRQINTALNSGKQHLMFYGPPGTGKTTLARHVAGMLHGQKWAMITGSADWTSQEIIGGYQPIENGVVRFFPGVLLCNFDRPLVIDELNRCDIDKVIGPLFTVLSGQQTTLPYRLHASDPESPQYVILPNHKDDPLDHEFAPGPSWRLLATINSIDKASLYQMSYALSRRFGWIFVDAPKDTKAFIQNYMEQVKGRQPETINGVPPLAAIWDAINQIRTIGPAPIIDAINAIEIVMPGSDLFNIPNGELRVAYTDAFDLFMLPLLDGILRHEAEQIASQVSAALGVSEDGSELEGLKRRILSVAV